MAVVRSSYSLSIVVHCFDLRDQHTGAGVDFSYVYGLVSGFMGNKEETTGFWNRRSPFEMFGVDLTAPLRRVYNWRLRKGFPRGKVTAAF